MMATNLILMDEGNVREYIKITGNELGLIAYTDIVIF
jgi:hypothetical protein